MPIVVLREDGGVSIMRLYGPTAEAALSSDQLDSVVKSEIAKWPAEVQEQVVSWQEVPEPALPGDRTFRDAWVADAGAIAVDMPKARELWRNRMRRVRERLLQQADVEFMRASERGESTTEIVARKQALRDATADPAIEAAQTADELKSVWPEILTREAKVDAPPSLPIKSDLEVLRESVAALENMALNERLMALEDAIYPALIEAADETTSLSGDGQ